MSQLLGQQDIDARALRRGTLLFVLAGLLLVAATVAAILVRQGLFRQTVSLGFVTESATDISKGMPVRVAGFRVGAVDSVDLRPDDGQVEVKLAIDADYMRFVTRDARVELRKEGLVGSPSMEIVPGPDKSRLAAADARLAFSRADGLTALANQVRDEFIPILKDVRVITGALADPHNGLPGTLARLRDSSERINTLLASGNKQVDALGAAAGGVLGQAEADLAHLGRTLETANQRLPALLDTTQRALEHAERIAREAEQTVPPALRDGSRAAADAREIVSGAKTAWPIRNFIPPADPAPMQADSDLHGLGGQRAPR